MVKNSVETMQNPQTHKTRHIRQFIKNLNSILTKDQKELILKQKESRLDSENHFFIRFDKEKLTKNKQLEITDKGNCYHLKLSIAAFPTTRQNSLKIIDDIFSK